MPCLGNAEDHCCYVNDVVCKYLEEKTVNGRRWACGLKRALGSWDNVIASTEYQTDVAPYFEPLGMNCKDWPDGNKGNRGFCVDCGITTPRFDAPIIKGNKF